MDALLLALVVGTVVAVFYVCAIVRAQIIYDDWTCAFAKCVKVKL